MPYDGSGNFDRVHNWTADEGAGIKVRADRFDAENDDFATGFENAITRDGQGKPSADINWNNKKITNLADPTTLTGATNVRSVQQNSFSFGTTAGGPTAYTLSLGITVASLVDGQPFFAEINATNTGASSLNVDSFGAKTIKSDGQDLVAGELIANSIYLFAYNAGTGFIDLLKPANATETIKGIVEFATKAETVTGTSTTLSVHPDGANALVADRLSSVADRSRKVKISNDSGDTDHDIKVTAGTVIDSTDADLITLPSDMIKRIDASWTAGTGNGGFPSGISLSPNSNYHFFLIKDVDTGTIDAGFDSALNASNLLADATAYDLYRRVGSMRTDGSSNIYLFLQTGNYFYLKTPILDFSGAPSTTASLKSISTPSGIKTLAIITLWATAGGANSNNIHYVSDPDGTDLLPSSSVLSVAQAVTDGFSDYGNTSQTITNTSSQIRLRSVQATGGTLYLAVQGWQDFFED